MSLTSTKTWKEMNCHRNAKIGLQMRTEQMTVTKHIFLLKTFNYYRQCNTGYIHNTVNRDL